MGRAHSLMPRRRKRTKGRDADGVGPLDSERTKQEKGLRRLGIKHRYRGCKRQRQATALLLRFVTESNSESTSNRRRDLTDETEDYLQTTDARANPGDDCVGRAAPVTKRGGAVRIWNIQDSISRWTRTRRHKDC